MAVDMHLLHIYKREEYHNLQITTHTLQQILS